MSGAVIMLNGTSSSGKSSVARALQRALPSPWLYMSADGVLGGYPFAHPAAEPTTSWRPLGRLFYETVRLFTDGTIDVIAEQVFQNPLQPQDAVEVLNGRTLWFVGVRCDLSEAERRESSRNDGTASGTARAQYNKVHVHGCYDIEVDTTSTSADDAARSIIAQLSTKPSAFEKLALRSRQ